MEPEELLREQRWSSIPEQSARGALWPPHLDDKLLQLVTNATASGDRFPVGVNWLEICRAIGHSPVECVKRYAYLHELRQRHDSSLHDTMQRDEDEHHSDDGSQAPFSGLSSSDDLGSPHSRSFLEYGSPLVSPRLLGLDATPELGVGSPSSPPPFALKTTRQLSGVASPLRWESVAKETYSSPVLRQPPHVLRQQQQQQQHEQLRTSFGIQDDSERPTASMAHEAEAHSPRIVHGTQDHSKFTDPGFAAELVSQAFRGLRFDDAPPTASPRMIRAISNSEFPFLKEEDVGSAKTQRSAADTPPEPRARQQPSSGVASPLGASIASAYGDHLLAGSLTQSALEDAFLDMAGSRLDASSA
ncbi:hypothetical protein P43SY_005720 [Pythium insidiosum]|uniref:Myb-like domain-containing protein n=1 Tax=Pythium insidiosum TaxID=114742 RepID=A0AAD5QFB6_PYTIN|nr:hypothetical protein P43SY_005720 [Pythium insidiosum]